MTREPFSDAGGSVRSEGQFCESYLDVGAGAADLMQILTKMQGQQCWSCAAMPVTGSTISLHYGQSSHWQSNEKKLTVHEGEYALYVENAAWRILRGECAVMTSDTAMTEERAAVLAKVMESPIVSATICPATLDVKIVLDSGVRFDIFSNCMDESTDNYTLIYKQRYYSVTFRHGKLMVRVEDYE
ncbi:MAG: hypothetical protein U0996_19685 [Planctomycetaceae bacterium]